MRNEIGLDEPRWRITPVRECPNRNRAPDRRDCSGTAAPRAALLSLRLQGSIDGGRAHLQERCPHLRCQRQMTMAFHRLDQCRNDRLQALAANSIRCLPQHDQRLALGCSVDAPRRPWRGTLGRWTGAQHAHCVLAMVACRSRELVNDRLLVDPATRPVPLAYRCKQRVPRRHADPPHPALRPAPGAGATQARQRS